MLSPQLVQCKHRSGWKGAVVVVTEGVNIWLLQKSDVQQVLSPLLVFIFIIEQTGASWQPLFNTTTPFIISVNDFEKNKILIKLNSLIHLFYINYRANIAWCGWAVLYASNVIVSTVRASETL